MIQRSRAIQPTAASTPVTIATISQPVSPMAASSYRAERSGPRRGGYDVAGDLTRCSGMRLSLACFVRFLRERGGA